MTTTVETDTTAALQREPPLNYLKAAVADLTITRHPAMRSAGRRDALVDMLRSVFGLEPVTRVEFVPAD